MARKPSSRKLISYGYDFATNTGAVGAINLGVAIPAQAVIWYIYIRGLVTCTSGGAATIRIGWSGSTAALTPDTTTYSDFAAGSFVNNDYWLSPLGTGATTRALIMTIGAAALTAGKFVGAVYYSELNE